MADISVVFCSRGRPASLRDSIYSLKRNAEDWDEVEVLVAVDPDDSTVPRAYDLLAEYGAQPREVVIERIQSAIPIASAVDFQALQGSEPAVRGDEFSGQDFHGPPVRRFRSYSIGTRERLHDRRHHSPL